MYGKLLPYKLASQGTMLSLGVIWYKAPINELPHLDLEQGMVPWQQILEYQNRTQSFSQVTAHLKISGPFC